MHIARPSLSEKADSSESQWFCVRSKPKSEHLAAIHLNSLPGVEAYCPRIRYQKVTRRGKVWFHEALFPNYLFARYQPLSSLRAVRYASGVTTVLHFGERFPVVPDNLIAELKMEFGEEEGPEIARGIEAGDEVHLAGAGMQGWLAEVIALDDGKSRAQVLVEFLGRQQLLDVDQGLLLPARAVRESLVGVEVQQ